MEKFKGLLVASTFAAVANYVVGLADPVIAGNLMGPVALAGVNLAAPIISFSQFLSFLIAIGVGTCYSISLGRCDKRRADEYFTQGLWSIVLLCGALSLAMLFGGDTLIAFFRPTPEIAEAFRSYLTFISPIPLLQGFVFFFVTMAYADGAARLAMIANGVLLAGSVGFSILGIKLGFGLEGCAAGTVLATLLALVILVGRLFLPSNTLRVVRHFAFRDTFKIGAASFGDAAASLCQSLLLFFLNAFVVRQFGAEVLPIVGVATVVWGFLVIFDSIGNAAQPIVTVYFGEGNYPAIRRVMNAAMKVCLFEGVTLAAIFLLFPEFVVRAVGISDPEMFAQAISAVRGVAVAFIAFPFAGLFNSYYMFIERPLLAGVLTFLAYLIVPVASIAMGSLVSIDYVWAGLSFGVFAGILMALIVIYATTGKSSVPLLLPNVKEGLIRVFDLSLEDAEIAEVSRRVAGIPDVPMKASLMVEEVLEVVRERNRGRRILGEVTVDLTDGVKLTIRDDGQIFDITDADQQISSLRSFLVASIMERQSNKINIITTGYNRNVFRF